MRICEIEERVTAIIAEDILQKYEIVSGQSDSISDTRNGGFVQAPIKYKMILC